MKEPVRAFNGKIIGWVETDNEGNQLIRAFTGKVLAKYDKKFDVTRDFYGRVISRGNTAIGQLYNPSINPDYKP